MVSETNIAGRGGGTAAHNDCPDRLFLYQMSTLKHSMACTMVSNTNVLYLENSGGRHKHCTPRNHRGRSKRSGTRHGSNPAGSATRKWRRISYCAELNSSTVGCSFSFSPVNKLSPRKLPRLGHSLPLLALTRNTSRPVFS